MRQGAIVYKTSPEQIGFYNYHRWATEPRDFVTNAVADRLRASGTFTQVKPYDGRADIDYVLSGRLEKLEEIDYDGGVKVIAKLSAELLNLRTGRTDWTGDAAETLSVDQRSVNSVVSEMSNAVQNSIARLVASLDRQPPPR